MEINAYNKLLLSQQKNINTLNNTINNNIKCSNITTNNLTATNNIIGKTISGTTLYVNGQKITGNGGNVNINNNTPNGILTVDGVSNTLYAQSGLTYDGSNKLLTVDEYIYTKNGIFEGTNGFSVINDNIKTTGTISGNIQTSSNIFTTNGNIYTISGNITTTKGNIATNNGYIYGSNGFTVDTSGNITTLGNILKLKPVTSANAISGPIFTGSIVVEINLGITNLCVYDGSNWKKITLT
jgi:hypothetical protein